MISWLQELKIKASMENDQKSISGRDIMFTDILRTSQASAVLVSIPR